MHQRSVRWCGEPTLRLQQKAQHHTLHDLTQSRLPQAASRLYPTLRWRRRLVIREDHTSMRWCQQGSHLAKQTHSKGTTVDHHYHFILFVSCPPLPLLRQIDRLTGRTSRHVGSFTIKDLTRLDFNLEWSFASWFIGLQIRLGCRLLLCLARCLTDWLPEWLLAWSSRSVDQKYPHKHIWCIHTLPACLPNCLSTWVLWIGIHQSKRKRALTCWLTD